MEKPNIIYIFCDQFRRQAVGYMGEDPVITPNLDTLAQDGVVFKQAVSNYPVCSPYRGILFTGMYPNKNNIYTNCHSESAKNGCYLREDQVCLTDILADNGYNLGYIGKWHLDAPNPLHNDYTEGVRGDGKIWDAYTEPGKKRHGFNFWYSYGCDDHHMKPHYWVNDAKLEERTDVEEWSITHETKVAIDYIKKQDQPFGLFISFNPPHTGFDMFPQEYLEHYKGKEADDLLVRDNVKETPQAIKHVKNYFASITGIDEHIGQILDTLKEKGIEDNTIVVFTSDHGEMMGSHGLMHKNIWYEESMGVPFIVRYPDKFKHQDTDAQLSTIDIMPTLLGAVGLHDQIPTDCQGYDYSVSMESGNYLDTPEESLYYCWGKHNGSGRGIRDRRYTFILCTENEEQRCVLHDRIEDPYQLKNIASENPELVSGYLNKLKKKLEEIEDDFVIKL